jgi:hypothetical protein
MFFHASVPLCNLLNSFAVATRLEIAVKLFDLLERAMGIEPTSEAWEASILPLYDARSGGDSAIIPKSALTRTDRDHKACASGAFGGPLKIPTSAQRWLR